MAYSYVINARSRTIFWINRKTSQTRIDVLVLQYVELLQQPIKVKYKMLKICGTIGIENSSSNEINIEEKNEKLL